MIFHKKALMVILIGSYVKLNYDCALSHYC